jgi:hypothetical protein
LDQEGVDRMGVVVVVVFVAVDVLLLPDELELQEFLLGADPRVESLMSGHLQAAAATQRLSLAEAVPGGSLGGG